MITAILQFFGKILLWIYNTCGSYALALAIFTLLTKLVLFPLSYKGKRSMMQMNSMNAELQRLQKQYGKDQQRYQLEVQKLYEEEHINPMGGCLWSLLPLPILMGLYYVIRRPMLYMLCLTEDQITTAVDTLANLGYTIESSQSAYQEIHIMNLISQNSDLYSAVSEALGDAASQLQTINFNFLGIDLGSIPDWQFWNWETVDWSHIGLALIPIGVTALNFLYTQYSMRTNQIRNQQTSSNDAAANSAAQTNKMMMYLMPLMYLWFGYIMPAGMCVYMACNAVFSALQDLIFTKFLNKKFAAEEEERQARLAAKRQEEKEKKAEIAARRAAMEEELRKKGGKKAVKQAQKAAKKKNQDSAAGQIGVRRYARGRAYDPERYPITSYRDPQDVLDEEALERALAQRGKKLPVPEEEPEAEAPVTQDAPEQLPEETQEPETQSDGGQAEE